MIIKDIYIDGFGIFNGFSLNKINKGINIIVGNNEAGKSTLLKFLRYTLFGYPRFKDQRMPPLRGGSHGGSVKAILSSGKEIVFKRSGDDSISFLYDGVNSQNQSQWAQLLGNASADLYNNVYSFSLEELVDISSLTESGVEDKIFSVGLGLGNLSIGVVESEIKNSVDNIYTARGHKQLMPGIIKQLENKKARIGEIQQNIPRYNDLKTEIKNLENELGRLDDEIREMRFEKNKLENYLKCYQSYVIIVSAENELKKLPALQDYPIDGINKLDKLEQYEEKLAEEISELKNGKADQKGVEELKNDINSISYNERLLERRDTVEYLDKNLEKYKQAITDKSNEEQKINKYNQSIKKGISDISYKWAENDVTGFSDIISHKNVVEEFVVERNKLAEEIRYAEAQLKAFEGKESSINVNNVFTFLAIISLIGSVPAFFYGVYVLGGSLVVIALILFFGKKHILKKNIQSNSAAELESLKMGAEETRKAFQDYLKNKLNLPPTLSEESSLKVFELIEELKSKINDREALRNKINNERIPFISDFESKALSVKDTIGNSSSKENIEVLVNQIVAEHKRSDESFKQKTQLQKELSSKEKVFENNISKSKQIISEIDNLLKSINASDRQEFRKKYEENNKVKELTDKKKSSIETMETIAGYGKADEVITFFNETDKETVDSRVEELAELIELKEKEAGKGRRELGEKINETRSIEGKSELADVLTELETEKQKLKDAYKDWLNGNTALKILSEVKAKYEKEKQPEVIKASGNYFNKITGDKYRRIRVSMDEKEVAVFDAKEESKKIGQLSRGTKEQLLVSLRLGFIEEYEKRAEPLPVIVDEILVNFDQYRAKQTAEILQEFGKERQVLIFTCHKSTIDYFDSKNITVNQI